jgi:tetratricopeptide (TPR) repeat protein/predicted ATPase/serine/threonine protein kinase
LAPLAANRLKAVRFIVYPKAVNDDVTISITGFAAPIPQVEKVEGLNLADFPVQFGRYKLKGLLGQGGMARVFLAELQGPAGFRKPVALKVIQPKKGKKASTKETFDLIREACLAGRLKHPNLVDVYELGEANEQLFISMELVEGQTLSKLIQSTSRIPPAVIFEIALGIARGLKKAHGRISKERPFGLVHCDLKPSNILISMEGEVKIGDFGVAIQRDFGTDLDFELSGLVQGTPSYMSPEQIQALPLDGRSDLFSTGLLVAEMVLGKKPLPKHFVMETLLAGKPLRAPLLTTHQFDQIEQITPGLGGVVLRCLAPDRENRFHNAEALVDALRGLQSQVGYEPRLHRWLHERDQPTPKTPKSTKNRPAKKAGPAQDSSFFNEVTQAVESAKNLSNIEPSLDRFVGRETELTTLDTYFREGARLVTLKGFGGAGKTRFSRRFARTKMFDWKGGAWFVELTERTTVLGVAHAIATVLDIPLSGQGDEHQIMNHLGERIAGIGPVLIVLDNFEQVIDHAPTTVGKLLKLAPEAMFLVTSRESLKLSAELIFHFEPLPVKDSVELFKLRAETAGSRWPKTKKTDAIIQRITKRLDGLPLAIELAAARARMMSPEQILERLSQRFKLLAGGRRGAIPRQATLRALIDWSWDLLEPWEKSALAQVSVFREGFSMEAAEAVLDLSAWPEAPWSLDVVGSLLDKSLLRSRQVLGQPRFEMYVSIHEYASEKLNDVADLSRPDAAQETQHRHASWFANLGNYITAHMSDSGSHSQSSAELIDELENLIAGASHGTPKTAAECSILAIRVLMLTGPVSLGADLASQTLRLPDLPRHLRMQLETSRSRCLRLAGSMAEARTMVSGLKPKKTRAAEEVDSGSALASPEAREQALLEARRVVELGNIEIAESKYPEAERCYLSALKLFQKHDDRTGEGETLGKLGSIYRLKGELDRAAKLYIQAIGIAREMGNLQGECIVLGKLGIVYKDQGQHDLAAEHFTKAIDNAREIGDKVFEGNVLGSLGTVFNRKGDLDRAVEHYTQAINITREVGDRRNEGVHLSNLGLTYLHKGELDRAAEHLTQAIDIAREIGDKYSEGINLGNLGDVLFRQNRFEEAEAAYQKTIPISDETFPAAAGAFRASLALLLAQKSQLDEAQELLKIGEPQVVSYPIEHAKFLGKKSQVQLLAGEPEAAQKSFDQAKALATKHKLKDDVEVTRALSDLEALLESPGTPDEPAGEDRTFALLEAERLLELGNIEEAESKYAEAERCYLSALELSQQHSHRAGEGEAIGCLGLIYQNQGQHDRAVEHFTQAVDIAREIGDKHGEGTHLGNLGNGYKLQGQYDRAIEHFTQAINIAREIGGKLIEGSNLGNLGGVYQEQGQYDRAAEHFTQAINIAREIGDKINEGISLGNLGDILFQQKRLEEAEDTYRKAISICDETKYAAAGAFRGSLALLLAQQDQFDEAHDLLESGEPQVVAHPEEYAKFLYKKGQVQLLTGESEAAQKSLDQAKALVVEHKFENDVEVAQAISDLEALLESPGTPDKPTGEDRAFPLLEAARLMELGNIEFTESKLTEAVHCYLSALELFQKHGDRTGEGEAIGCLGTVYQEQGQHDRSVEHFTQALDIAREIGNKRGEGIFLGRMGTGYQIRSELDQAVEFYTQALDIARELGDKSMEGIHLGSLGNIYQQKGDLDRTVEYYDQAIDIAREIGHKRSEGIHLGNLGVLYQTKGELDRASDHFRQAIDISLEIGDTLTAGSNLGNLGDTLFQQNRLEEAEAAFRKAIPIGDETYPLSAGVFRASLALLLAQKGQRDEPRELVATGEPQVVPHPEEHAKFLCKKGQVQFLAGEPDAAQKSLDQAIAIATEHKIQTNMALTLTISALEALIESPGTPNEPASEDREFALLEAERLVELGKIEFAESKYAEAEQCYRKALAIFQKHSDRAGQGVVLGNLGNIYKAQGQHDRAVEHYTQALDIAREIGDKHGEGIHLGYLGTIYKEQGQLDRAVEHYTKAIDIAREIGDKRNEGVHLGNLGDIYKEQGQPDRAVEHFTRAIDISREIGDKRKEGVHLGQLGIVCKVQRQYDRAVGYYTQAIDIAREIGDKRSESIHLGNLGDILFQQNRLEEAGNAFRKAIHIGDKTMPAAAGAFRSDLALLLAQQGQLDEAQELLKIGEPLVVRYSIELAKFLGKKGQVQLLASDLKAAQASLDRAKVIATDHKLENDGDVAQTISALEALLESPGTPDEPAGEDRAFALLEAARLMELGNIEKAESNYAEAEKCYRSALAIFQKHGDRAGEGVTLGNLGACYRVQGQIDRAIEHHTQAIDIAREVGDKGSEGTHLGNLGVIYQEQGQGNQAVEHLTKTIDIAREIGDKLNEGIHLGNLGGVYQEQGQHHQAADHFTQALDIARVVGNKSSEGSSLGHLGSSYQLQGQHDRAVEHFTQAIDIAREIGNKRNEGVNLGNLGDTFAKIAQHDKAEDAFRKSIPICDETFPVAAGAFRASLAFLLAQQDKIDEAQALLKTGEPLVENYPLELTKFLCKRGQVHLLADEPEAAQKSLDQAKALATEHKSGDDSEVAQAIAELTALLDSPDEPTGEDRAFALLEAERLMELGNIEKAESKYAEAKQCFRSALELFQKHGDRAGEGEAIGNLGGTYRVQGQLGRATEHYTQAIDIAKEIGDKSIEGRNFGNLGTVYEEQGQHDRAAEHFTQAINIAREIGSKRGEGIMLGNLGNVYREQGQYDRAAEHHTQAIDIAREVGDKRSEGIHLGNLGDVYKQQGQHDRAVEHFTRAIDIAREVGDKRNEALNLGILGIVCKFQRQYDRAVDYFTQAIDIAREIGDKRFECMHLGNLGDILFQQNRLEEAENAFRKAIHIGDKTLPGAAGAFRGSLALLLAQQGQIVETQELLKIGEAQVETYPSELAKFVGKKGQVQLLASDLKAAQASLDRAIALVTEHKLENDVEVAQAISELEGLISHSN